MSADICSLYYDYLNLINECYKNRNNEASLNKCIEFCLKSIDIFPEFKKWYINEYGKWDNLSAPCFKQLAIIYENQGEFDKAIAVCRKAMSYGLDDKTKYGYPGRIEKLQKKKNAPPPRKRVQNNLPKKQISSEHSVSKNLDLEKFKKWYVSISFNRSNSSNFSKALALAKSSDQYIETQDAQGNTIYQAVYSDKPSSYLKFIQLYEMINGWKSCFTILNGKIIDRKIIGGLNYCYGDKIRSGNNNFCFGASEFTENPFGCHRLQISSYNHPWWSFGNYDAKRIWHINKDKILERIHQKSGPYRQCPAFNYDKIIERLDGLPDTINPITDKDWEYGVDGVHPKRISDGSINIEIKFDIDDIKEKKKDPVNQGCATSILSCLSIMTAFIYFLI